MRRPVAAHPLAVVKGKIDNGDVDIRENARQGAVHDFEWGPDDILAFIKRLRPSNLVSSMPHDHIPGAMVDSYIAVSQDGERVFTHFYVARNGHLVISSCHLPRG